MQWITSGLLQPSLGCVLTCTSTYPGGLCAHRFHSFTATFVSRCPLLSRPHPSAALPRRLSFSSSTLMAGRTSSVLACNTSSLPFQFFSPPSQIRPSLLFLRRHSHYITEVARFRGVAFAEAPSLAELQGLSVRCSRGAVARLIHLTCRLLCGSALGVTPFSSGTSFLPPHHRRRQPPSSSVPLHGPFLSQGLSDGRTTLSCFTPCEEVQRKMGVCFVTSPLTSHPQ